MKLTHKDILLLLGIIVAVIITLTTLVYTERTSTSPTSHNNDQPKAKTSMNSSILAKKLIEVIDFKSRVHY